MDEKKIQVQALTRAKHLNFVVSFFSYILLVYTAIYSQHAAAETNVSGVEIEISNEPVASNLVGDPVQNFLTDLDTNDNNQEDLWARIKDGYAMPDIESQYTSTHEAWYAARPDYVKRMVERSQRYLFHIVEEVQTWHAN